MLQVTADRRCRGRWGRPASSPASAARSSRSSSRAPTRRRRPRSPSAAAPRSAGSRSPAPRCACSAGVAAFPAHATTVPQLLHAADGALYWAKRSGRNRVRVYDPRHVVALSLVEQRREVEAMLARAAPIVPAFQPMMEVATGRVAGYEALARFAAPWERPPHLWFAQAHRCGLGRRARGARGARRARRPRPARRARSSRSTSRPPRCSRPRSSDALPRDLDGDRDRADRARGLRRGRRARARAGRAARPRRAHRARRRRRGLRRAPAADPRAPGHRQGRPLARRRHPRGRVEARAARGARALRDDDRRRRLRRGRRGAQPSCARSPASTSPTRRATRSPARARLGP